jgi:hypothetical protein
LESGILGEKFGSEAAVAVTENEGLAGRSEIVEKGATAALKLNHSNQR